MLTNAMPTTIACPGCRRALALPRDAVNRLVQCPACRHQFHPAAAETAAAPVIVAEMNPAAAAPEPAALERPDPAAPAPQSPRRESFPRRARRKRDYDLCPKCDGKVPPHAERCPECGVQFEEEKDEDYRPWEGSGEERRDSEPHRGSIVQWLGIVSILMGGLGFACAGVTSILGLPAGIAAILMGRSDLRKMEQHVMAREGRGATHGGFVCGIIGAVLNLVAMLVMAAYIIAMVLR